ncbi:hypothetical protein KEM48_013024 [Puccinia striiformis f. sp. tritici PST-130]|nr:hypothetical protein KEM48_013024 [Puccinia striiformis f. sp. tritici PST-130]
MSALALISEIFSSKRFRQTPLSALEPIMLRFINLSVLLRKTRNVKEGLHMYKNVAQKTSVSSVEMVVQHFITKSKEKLVKALAKVDEIEGIFSSAKTIPCGLSSHFSSSPYKLPTKVPIFVALTLLQSETHQQIPGSSLQDLTVGSFGAAVGLDITVSTTFRTQPPSDLVALQLKLGELNAHTGLSSTNPNLPGSAVSVHSSRSPSENYLATSLQAYMRTSHLVLSQTEKRVRSILNGDALVYSSGLSAAFAALMLLSPYVIAILDGYRGCHEVHNQEILQLRGMGQKNSVEVKVIDLDDCYPLPESGLRVLVRLETPVNPTGKCRDIQSYVRKVRQCAGGLELLVDSTLVPPPLSNPFAFTADVVLYSGSKYFGGHSDTLCGILVTHKSNPARWRRLWSDRTHLGMLPGSLESWLLLRSVKTLQLRVIHQADTATRLAVWLNSLTERDYRSDTDLDETRRLVSRVWHSSFQDGRRWVGFDPQTNKPRQIQTHFLICLHQLITHRHTKVHPI